MGDRKIAWEFCGWGDEEVTELYGDEDGDENGTYTMIVIGLCPQVIGVQLALLTRAAFGVAFSMDGLDYFEQTPTFVALYVDHFHTQPHNLQDEFEKYVKRVVFGEEVEDDDNLSENLDDERGRTSSSRLEQLETHQEGEEWGEGDEPDLEANPVSSSNNLEWAALVDPLIKVAGGSGNFDDSNSNFGEETSGPDMVS